MTTETTTKFKRPETLDGITAELPTPCGNFYLTLNECGGKLREVRMGIGKSGNCMRMLFETIAILVSVMLQSNIPKDKIVKTLFNQLEGNCGNRIYYKGEEYHSCLDYAIRKIIEDMAGRGEVLNDET